MLKPVYTAADEDAALAALTAFADSTLGKKYPAAVATWENAWDRFTPFLAFGPALRKVIYTTNSIESLNYQLRKIIKNRGHFPNDQAVLKLLLLLPVGRRLRGSVSSRSAPTSHTRSRYGSTDTSGPNANALTPGSGSRNCRTGSSPAPTPPGCKRRGFSQKLLLQSHLTILTLQLRQPRPLRHTQRRLHTRMLFPMRLHPHPQRLSTHTMLTSNLRHRLRAYPRDSPAEARAVGGEGEPRHRPLRRDGAQTAAVVARP